MGRAPCCDKANVKKGPWSPEEDAKLKSYIDQHGTGGNWIALPQKIGLKRCGKSCRLRWLNYLRPNIKHGGFSEEEDNIICSLYVSIGSRWSIIAAQLPGRTDNDIKNYWNTRLKKKLLGKQRKEQVRRQKQEIKTETENLNMVSGIQPPYWPSIPVLTNNNASIQHYDLNNNQTSFLNNKHPSSGFSLQQPYMNACDIIPSTQDQPNYNHTINPVGNGGSTCHPPSNTMFEGGFESFTSDLSELVCVNPQQMEGFYGMEYSVDSTITTSTESTSWGDISLVYSPLVNSHYQAAGCRHGIIPQDHVPFDEESRYFGMQMQ